MPLEPLGSEETEKARRRVETTLLADRVLRPQTRTRCEQLLDQLLVENMHLTLEQLLGKREADAELVSKALVTYGKQLLYSGKSHGRYSETINAVAAKRPTLKRLLAGAWDLAFAWVTDEPHAHHPATPLSVVLAFGGLALLLGLAGGSFPDIDDLDRHLEGRRGPCKGRSKRKMEHLARSALLQIRQPKT